MKRAFQPLDGVEVEHVAKRKIENQRNVGDVFSTESTKRDSQVEHNTKITVNNDFSLKQELPCLDFVSHTDFGMQESIKTNRGDNQNKLVTQTYFTLGESTKDVQVECIANEVKNETTGIKHKLSTVDFKWKLITRENLNLSYAKIFSSSVSHYIFRRLEKEVEYFSGDLLKVRVYGKWHNIPRKQVAFGDEGLSYAFSGNSLPAKPWNICPVVCQLKEIIESVTGESFNFVLINRYANGADHMGEHRDDEKELAPKAPIASLSFGEVREFVFKHKDSRGKNSKRNIPSLKMDLESGSLLLMNYPTNQFWYHSLPVRKKASNVRVNLTFRRMILK